ncbi:MAG: Trypsin-like peptidase domain [Candidatus Parcubacteria bacterium]|jgi:hypothetical protein
MLKLTTYILILSAIFISYTVTIPREIAYISSIKHSPTVQTEKATTTPKIAVVEEENIVKKPEVKSKIKKEESAISQETPLPFPAIQKTEIIDFESINERSRKALVNILCTSPNNTLNPLSGSGVVIDPKGIILTNAHIGQFFLLSQYIDCIIRTGSPAYPSYKAKLIHISSTWIEDNAFQINKENALGTGENDYALLLITEKIDGTKIEGEIPYLDVSYAHAEIGEYTLLASYPAGFLGGIAILRDLYAVSSIAEITEIFTFEGSTVDLFSIGGTISSQKGSSGGAAIDKEGKLKGIIVTATESEQTSGRDLRAISIEHINRNITREKETGLTEILNTASPESIKTFETQEALKLRKLLIDVLQKQ